jgi:hypothetical protein
MQKEDIEKTCRLICASLHNLQKRIATPLSFDVWNELLSEELIALGLDVKMYVSVPNQRLEYMLQKKFVADLLVADCIVIYLEKKEHPVSLAEQYVSTLLYFGELPCGMYVNPNGTDWNSSWRLVWNERVFDGCLNF